MKRHFAKNKLKLSLGFILMLTVLVQSPVQSKTEDVKSIQSAQQINASVPQIMPTANRMGVVTGMVNADSSDFLSTKGILSLLLAVVVGTALKKSREDAFKKSKEGSIIV